MRNALRAALAGIVLILASLFFLGICILNSEGGFYPDGLSLALFVIGVIIAVIGLFFVKE